MENKSAALPRVEGDDLEWEGQLQTWNGAPFTGIEVWRFPSGAMESEATYKDGLTDGPARTWDEQGQLRSQFTCRLGAMHGNCKKWHANDQLAEDGNYEWGVRLDEKKRRGWAMPWPSHTIRSGATSSCASASAMGGSSRNENSPGM